MQYVFNHRILKTSNPNLSPSRIEHHFAHQTIWEIMYRMPKSLGEIPMVSVFTPNGEEMYGSSLSVVNAPEDCLSPVWSQD